MQTIDDLISATAGGRIFGVTFIKRTTGERRDMNCRCEVKAHLKGGEPAYDFAAKKLLPVFDMQKQAYRSVSLDTIVSVRIAGKVYTFDGTTFTEVA